MKFLKTSESSSPRIFTMAAEVVLHADLREALSRETLSAEYIQSLLEAARLLGIAVEEEHLEYVFRKNLERLAEGLFLSPEDLPLLEKLNSAVGLKDLLPFRVNLWKIQNIAYVILNTVYPQQKAGAQKGERKAREWVNRFDDLAGRLSVRVHKE